MLDRLKTQSPELVALQAELEPLRQALLEHRLYDLFKTPEHVRCFMSHHVFAVWDFMSLVKSLQFAFTSLTQPWLPPKNPDLARMINEVVLDEESDQMPDGSYLSHYQMYRQAMQEAGADDTLISKFMALLNANQNTKHALIEAGVPFFVSEFVQGTFQKIESQKQIVVAAAFCFGREGIIPSLFQKIIAGFPLQEQKNFSLFLYYLNRHIQIDSESHSVLALKMVEDSAQSKADWQEATESAKQALKERLNFFDGIAESLAAL